MPHNVSKFISDQPSQLHQVSRVMVGQRFCLFMFQKYMYYFSLFFLGTHRRHFVLRITQEQGWIRNEFAAFAREMLVQVWTEMECHPVICCVSKDAHIESLYGTTLVQKNI
ncbi:hypothetical protein TNIN_49781 [Trichonephila inaurata madagascariensis]|uniref:Uncharacterized protein n=1 Tax=Trichonephila inaurata madagascariensis TaxID=2747483 RepID=A0A8X7C6K6_9ARAC|nr:hypothetical protein TNIN_49781 [Trichonephila inaurata madagascariensis]